MSKKPYEQTGNFAIISKMEEIIKIFEELNGEECIEEYLAWL